MYNSTCIDINLQNLVLRPCDTLVTPCKPAGPHLQITRDPHTINLSLCKRETPKLSNEGYAGSHARGLIAHGDVYSGYVRFGAMHDASAKPPKYSGHKACHARNTIDAGYSEYDVDEGEDKTVKKVCSE